MRRVFLSGSVVIMTLLISMSEGFAQAPGESPAVPAMSSGTMAGPTAGSPPPSLALRRDQPEDDGPMAAPRDADRGAESSGGMKTTPARPDSGMSDMGGMMSMGGDEHASHHPGMGGMGIPGAPSSRPTEQGNMMSRMLPQAGQALSAVPGADKADAGCCGARGRTPLYTFMMTHPKLTDAERQMLADIAAQRLQDGLREVGTASVDATQSLSWETMRRSSQHLHDGVALLDSGMAARAAATGLVNPQMVAFNWFTAQMGLPTIAASQQNGLFFGLTPAHLVFMTILILVSIALLILQVLRLHRVQEILTTTTAFAPKPTVPPMPPSSTGGGPTPPVPPPPPVPGPGGGTATPIVDVPRRGLWRGSLKVARIIRETPAIVTFYLVPADGGRIPFDFKPGQFVQLTIEPTSGKPASRSYTIASSPGQVEHLELTIKREEHGLVSRYLHDTVKEGDLLKIAGPSGMFTFTGEEADSIVLLSGGVGITPMMAVLRYLTDIVWPGEIYFVYSAHASIDYVFRQEIEWLERRNDKLHVIATMRRSPGTEWSGPEGRITKELLQQSVPDLTNRRIHVCGPPGMMASMRALLTDLGVPEANVHSEAFGPAAMKAEPAVGPVAAPSSPAVTPAATTITFSTSGKSAPLQLDETVLDAADAAGVNIPSSCRSGICGMCMTHLLQGQVTMAVEDGLDPADKAKGFILACQAKTTGGPLVVEA